MNLSPEEQKFLSLAPFYIPSLFDVDLIKPLSVYFKPDSCRQIKKGDILFHPETTPEYVYFLISGVMIDSTSNLNGLERFSLIFPGYPMGFHPAIHKQPILYTSKAYTNCQVIPFTLEELLNLMQENKDVLHSFLKLIALETRYTNNIVVQNSTCSTFEKIIQTLYFYHLTQKHYPPLTEIKLTQQLLAGLAGVHRTSVGIAMKDLKDQEIISIDKKHLTIHQPEKLKQMAFEQY